MKTTHFEQNRFWKQHLGGYFLINLLFMIVSYVTHVCVGSNLSFLLANDKKKETKNTQIQWIVFFFVLFVDIEENV